MKIFYLSETGKADMGFVRLMQSLQATLNFQFTYGTIAKLARHLYDSVIFVDGRMRGCLCLIRGLAKLGLPVFGLGEEDTLLKNWHKAGARYRLHHPTDQSALAETSDLALAALQPTSPTTVGPRLGTGEEEDS